MMPRGGDRQKEADVSDSSTSWVARGLEQALGALDTEQARATYWEQDEFLCLERWLPAPLTACGRRSTATTSRATRRAAA
jgi:hypothetical protein